MMGVTLFLSGWIVFALLTYSFMQVLREYKRLKERNDSQKEGE